MVLLFCSFLALRFEDLKTPVKKIQDFDIYKENELFAGSVHASILMIGRSRHADESSMITTSMPSDCSKKRILASSDFKHPRKPVLSKGKENEATTPLTAVLIQQQEANLDSLHHPSDPLAHMAVPRQTGSGAPRRSAAIHLHRRIQPAEDADGRA